MKWYQFVAVLFALLSAADVSAQDVVFERINSDRLLAPIPLDRDIEIVDGDTIWIGIHEIRLYGIDAYEPKQPCSLKGHSKTYCHLSASAVLADFAAKEEFRCEIHVKDGENKPWIRYGRYIASCYVGAVDVNLALVRQGWAYADKNYGDTFINAQEQAEAEGLGIFGTEDPVAPWEWRKQQRGDYPQPCD